MKKRSSLLLVELMIAIFVFCVACAISLQSFAKANELSKEATTLNHAITIVESTIEKVKAGNDDIDHYYDADWNVCNQKEATYRVMIQETKTSSSLKQCTVSIYEGVIDSNPIYSIEYKYTLGGDSDE